MAPRLAFRTGVGQYLAADRRPDALDPEAAACQGAFDALDLRRGAFHPGDPGAKLGRQIARGLGRITAPLVLDVAGCGAAAARHLMQPVFAVVIDEGHGIEDILPRETIEPSQETRFGAGEFFHAHKLVADYRAAPTEIY